MAYVQNQFDEEDEENQANPGSEQVLSSGQSGVITGTGQGQAQGGQPGRSGNWTNLQNYIAANQGNDATMGQGVKSRVDQQANTLDSDIGTYRTDFENKVNEGTTRLKDGLVDAIKTAPKGIGKKDFDGAVDAQYKGPTDLSEFGADRYGKIQSQVSDFDRTISGIDKGLEGKTALLDKAYARPSYTGGEKNLDAFILGGGAAGQQSLRDIQAQHSDKGKGWATTKSDIGNAIKTGMDTTAKTRQTARAAVDETLGGYRAAVNDDALLRAQTARNAEYQEILRLINGGSPIEQRSALQGLGVDLDLSAMGVNPSEAAQFLRAGKDLNHGDLLDAEKRGNWDALMSLLGESPNAPADTQDEGAAASIDHAAMNTWLATKGPRPLERSLPGSGATAVGFPTSPVPVPTVVGESAGTPVTATGNIGASPVLAPPAPTNMTSSVPTLNTGSQTDVTASGDINASPVLAPVAAPVAVPNVLASATTSAPLPTTGTIGTAAPAWGGSAWTPEMIEEMLKRG